MTGIYMIRFGDDEHAHYYIGQSADIERRKKEHVRELRNRTHPNLYMQNVFNKYGEESMTFEVLCECSEDKLDELEEYYIYTMYAFVEDNVHGLNLTTGGNGIRNHAEETKQKISKAHKGKVLSEEVKQKLSKALTGKVVSDKTKQKISETKKGHVFSKETIQKMRNNPKKSKPVLCVELDKIFPSVMEAMRFMQETYGKSPNIGESIRGRRKTAGGFHWEYCSLKEAM